MANRLQCNLHSCGWISDVGVLYKGIWLPAEQHDIQLAPCRFSTHTLTCTHTDALIKETESETEQRVIHMPDYQDTRILLSQTDIETGTLHSKHAMQVSRLVLHLALCLPEVPVNQRALALPLAQQL